MEGGQEVSNGPYNLIVGDAQGDNNGGLTTLLPATIVNDSNLPADLARIFAGLAIFFAVMALVSAGTEVVIDSLKVGVGLKRKVTTMEALERMEKYLPGELASLSVSAASREQYKRMSREIRSTLGAVLLKQPLALFYRAPRILWLYENKWQVVSLATLFAKRKNCCRKLARCQRKIFTS